MSVLDELTQVLAQRKSEDPNTSYVASLHAKGLNKILEKIGEESPRLFWQLRMLAAAREQKPRL